MIRRTVTLSTIALCIAGAFGAAQADSRVASTSSPQLFGESSIVRSALSRTALSSADTGNTLRDRAAADGGDDRSSRLENRAEQLDDRADRGDSTLAGLDDSDSDSDSGNGRDLTLGRLKVSVATDSNRAGEDSDDQPAGASGKLTLSTIPQEGEDSDAQGSSVETGLAVKGPSPESDEGRRIGGNVESTLKAETPKRDDNSETNAYGGTVDVGLGGVVIAPERSE